MTGSHLSVCSISSGSCVERLEHAACAASGVSVPRICAEVQREQVQRDQLRRERLGRGDADLRSGVRVDRAVRLARGHAADDVADARCCGRPCFLASRSAASVSAVSPDCVIATASVFVDDDRIAVAELRAVVDVDRQRAPATRSGTCRPAPSATTCRRRGSRPARSPRSSRVGDLDLLRGRPGRVSTDARPSTVSRTAHGCS